MRHLVPALLIAAAAGTAQAADNNGRLIGFEFGVGYHQTDDSRYEGNDVNLALVIPVGTTFDVSVYHENGRYYGKQDGNKSNIDSDVNELRFRVQAWTGDFGGRAAAVAVFVGLGYADYVERETSTDWTSPVADVGIDFTPLRIKTGPLTADLSILATYRWARFDDQSLNLTDDLSKLGGFIIGASASLSF